eukprot:6179483-Pleurochrysis_carterae.AAC.5
MQTRTHPRALSPKCAPTRAHAQARWPSRTLAGERTERTGMRGQSKHDASRSSTANRRKSATSHDLKITEAHNRTTPQSHNLIGAQA